MTLDNFIAENHADMLADLTHIVQSLKRDLKSYAKDHNHDEPSIDIRLCIDPIDTEQGFNWIFRTGLSDYDPRHSVYCSAGCISLDSEASEVLDYLVRQLD